MEAPSNVTELVQAAIGYGQYRLAWRILLVRYRIIKINQGKVIPFKKMQRIVLELAVLQREFASKCT